MTIQAFSQDSISNYKSKLQAKPSTGFNVPISKLFKGEVTDHLFAYDDHSFYWQILSVTYFFQKHWGVEINFQAGSSKRISKRGDRLMQAMESEYGNNYYVTPAIQYDYNDFDIMTGHIQQGFFGVIYRMEYGRFFIYPKLGIGISSFDTDWREFYLKEKNSNTVLQVSYDSNGRPNEYYTAGASVAVGYKLTKRVFINLDFLTSYYKTDVSYTKTTKNLASGEQVEEKSFYKKNIFTQSFGVGLIFVINNGHRNQ